MQCNSTSGCVAYYSRLAIVSVLWEVYKGGLNGVVPLVPSTLTSRELGIEILFLSRNAMDLGNSPYDYMERMPTQDFHNR
jgi:hypothetical protein